MKWYFVRHGEIASNVKKIYAGWSQEGLTSRGHQQAIEAAKRLVFFDIDHIYTSPLKRAVQTADIIGGPLEIKPIFEESFKELKLGIWEGLSEEEVGRKYPDEWKIWNTRPAELVLDGRETLNGLLKRVLAVIEKVRAGVTNSSILIVTHVAVIRVLLLYTQKMDLNLYRTLDVPNGEIFEIDGELLQ